MREVFLGEYIKQRRLELGLTQEQLCEGICEPITISRLENGHQTPSRNNINALLQRLGLPGDRYYALLSKREQEIERLREETVSYNIRYQNSVESEREQMLSRALESLEELESIADEDDFVTKQFILRSKAFLGKPDGSNYSVQDRLDMLLKAIRLTVPRFDLEEINACLYSLDETKLICQIAGVYSSNGEHRKAVEILSQLIKYIQKHYQNILQSGGHLPLVSHNYALELYKCRRYEEAIEIADLGWQSCIKYGHYQFLAGIIHIKALCYCDIGDSEGGEELFRQSYYLYKAVGNEKGAALLQADAVERYRIKLGY